MGIIQEVQTVFSSSVTCQKALQSGQVFDFALAAADYPPVAGAAVSGLPFEFRLNRDVLRSNGTLQNYNLIVNRVLLVNAGSIGFDRVRLEYEPYL